MRPRSSIRFFTSALAGILAAGLLLLGLSLAAPADNFEGTIRVMPSTA